jgi:hypothetical protein
MATPIRWEVPALWQPPAVFNTTTSKQHEQRGSTTEDIKSAPEPRLNILINASTKATNTTVL